MITWRRIKTPDDRLLEQVIPLYEEAFPPVERRDAGQLQRVIEKRTNLYFNAIVEGAEPVGLLAYWDLQDFYYIEHLALFVAYRGRSIGTRVLEEVARCLVGIRLLEVEPPADPASERRVAYYERNGYRVLTRDYMQPSYDGKREGCPMWIMGNEVPARLAEFVERIQREVYRENEHI
ncbi:MAG: GNAT family N-acetyltransferase [Odoribacteraceae bacterium]|jgi:ribosomal protein S18 acetylase RimI-like enzyme|nr:GNAT family N-acetyltransferase [Odoribacteraceae bacterium]